MGNEALEAFLLVQRVLVLRTLPAKRVLPAKGVLVLRVLPAKRVLLVKRKGPL